ncbi:hypothetical protein SAMN04488009_3032 [Maribacter sedimenticola]|uniref:Uncharacterized protein n=1 Tax=Maribacter sedimenticola TaxID=228956 RepID=A0ABY1SKK1_9FLAO|nr:hypothetical protein JM81_0081 [Maribacter sp. MAR_2009_72]SNR65853.1 hypothetical protein SAMN04488009_3032 [Maribacter sedimenticola]
MVFFYAHLIDEWIIFIGKVFCFIGEIHRSAVKNSFTTYIGGYTTN